MTPDQVQQLADEGFGIGAHTSSHAPLGQSSPAVQQDELHILPGHPESWNRTACRFPGLSVGCAAARLHVADSGGCRGSWFHDGLHDQTRFCAPERARARTIALRHARRRLGRRTGAPYCLRLGPIARDELQSARQRPAHLVQPRGVHRGIDRERARADAHGFRADRERRPVDATAPSGSPNDVRAPRPARARVGQRAQSWRLRRIANAGGVLARGAVSEVPRLRRCDVSALSGGDGRGVVDGAARRRSRCRQAATGPGDSVRCC